MRILSYLTVAITLSLTLTVLTGCESQQSASEQTPSAGDGHNHGHEDEHKGPHDGHVIELGRNHEYHAEIVEDEQRQLVTVYILGNDIKELPIEAKKLTMSLMVEGEPRNFDLLAAGASGGKSSRFNAADASLFEALHEHEASGKLRVTINRTPFVGTIEHHDHDEHAHGDGHEH